MKYPIYTIRDVKVGFDTQFLPQISDDAAQRAFAMAINNPGTMLNFQPSDFELYKIGEFDTETGRIESVPVPEFICGGVDVYAKS